MEEIFNEKLNLDDLFKEKKETQQHKIKIYQRILARVHKKIKTTSRMRNSANFSFFLIPEFVLGIPRYNMAECTTYIIEKLSDNDQPAYWKMVGGLCGWAPGQLKAELSGQPPFDMSQSWLVANTNDDIMFNETGKTAWKNAFDCCSTQLFDRYF